jgi:3'(2'), 5'-bisphosphate nucleotidase
LVPNAAPEAVCEWIDRGAAAPSDRFWVLDPIDGTKGFLRGDQYVVALALVENGQVVLGALGCPNMDGQLNPRADSGALVLAAHGKGAWSMDLNGSVWRRIHVSDVREAARVRLLRSFEAAHTDGDKIAAFARALGAQAEPVRLDSQAKYAMLAGGRGEVVLRLLSPKRPDYREKIWDQAAGTLIVEEAGGVVTDLDGKPLDFSQGRLLVNNRGVIASNGHLHADMLVALRQIEA